ncbi:serine hydroxymethyltransferase [Actinacidiphila sp. ITFR-21]|uniref:serine hydroxymethyltransferase n=1 Tax=Actinacidiphila sp. ITFR-21 TaxID=3075199 RepID=UPI00288BF2E1|nr:serine hydroxymethyltransferase [Streptomyces sp. ITFR-21]WNI18661.1 serine hydroxymethyltransferase [Streptomyces sp. ITFR-21]
MRPADPGRLSGLRAELYDSGARQDAYERSVINLIASDNAVPGWRRHTLPYSGDMIQEGIVGRRPFAGAALHNELERIAAEVACEVFGVDHAILQPHSCSQANQAVYHGLLRPGDRVLALRFRAGGHLTHGMRHNFSGRTYAFDFYGVGADGRIDYDEALRAAKEFRPRLVVCGSSSYPWIYDVAALRALCDEVGAYLHLDLSHEAGLIAGGAFPCDLGPADVVTMSLDKTLRGPHGAAVLCRADLAGRMDAAVHPGTQSSFPVRRLTDAAAALLESQTAGFAEYARRSVALTRALGERLLAFDARAVVGGGSDKHYLLLDTERVFGRDGRAAEELLEDLGLLTNRQWLPHDRSSGFDDAGGLRLGTAWLSSCGYDTADADALADLLVRALSGDDRDDCAAAFAELVTRDRPGDVRGSTDFDWTAADGGSEA